MGQESDLPGRVTETTTWVTQPAAPVEASYLKEFPADQKVSKNRDESQEEFHKVLQFSAAVGLGLVPKPSWHPGGTGFFWRFNP